MGMEASRVIDRYLGKEDIDTFGAELEALRQRIRRDLGAQDLRYIRRVMRWQRRLERGGRIAIHVGVLNPLLWLAGVGALGASKILDNMEIGHNVMHGQYDWARDPALQGRRFAWQNMTPDNQWRHTHNTMHHRLTNILGQDRDVGYGFLRVTEAQPWRPWHLVQPLMALASFIAFEWGLSLHALELDQILEGRWRWHEHREKVPEVLRKWRQQIVPEYVVYPLLAGPFFLPVMLGNLGANVLRNMWAFTIIFCGHFPAGVMHFREEECRNETRGEWYVRQLLGSCNLDGGRWFHLMSGHLGFQIEHHLFPTIPAHRYPEMAPVVRALCAKYGLPYNTGPLHRQFGSVVKRLLTLALPPLPTLSAKPASIAMAP
ncbi:MAG: acyl-CoA desaturase [Moraxellaceae bacterium]|jgi:linoleoyl-CoA desaturase|nr:acyl-CoA desaturase [Moraxellaceae bacterium]